MHMEGVGLEHRSGRHRLMPDVARRGDNEKCVAMGTAEREEDDDEYLAVISFGCGMKQGLGPMYCEAKHSQFIGVFGDELVTVPRGGSNSGSCLNNELNSCCFRRRDT